MLFNDDGGLLKYKFIRMYDSIKLYINILLYICIIE